MSPHRADHAPKPSRTDWRHGRSRSCPTASRAPRLPLNRCRWGVDIDDSGRPVPLNRTLPGGVHCGSCSTSAEQAERSARCRCWSLLKHPAHAHGGTGARRGFPVRWLELLDRAALRGPRPSPGFAGLREAVEKLPEDDDRRRRARQLAELYASVRCPQTMLRARPRAAPIAELACSSGAYRGGRGGWPRRDEDDTAPTRLWSESGGAEVAAAGFIGHALARRSRSDFPPLRSQGLSGFVIASCCGKGVTVRPALWHPSTAVDPGAWSRRGSAAGRPRRPRRAQRGHLARRLPLRPVDVAADARDVRACALPEAARVEHGRA